ncbi:MAG: hypothetical protein Q4G30_10580 [Actinomycetaceae bacterium]|nr:hypothetical protein [Actinomycetaceae bacterium]
MTSTMVAPGAVGAVGENWGDTFDSSPGIPQGNKPLDVIFPRNTDYSLPSGVRGGYTISKDIAGLDGPMRPRIWVVGGLTKVDTQELERIQVSLQRTEEGLHTAIVNVHEVETRAFDEAMFRINMLSSQGAQSVMVAQKIAAIYAALERVRGAVSQLLWGPRGLHAVCEKTALLRRQVYQAQGTFVMAEGNVLSGWGKSPMGFNLAMIFRWLGFDPDLGGLKHVVDGAARIGGRGDNTTEEMQGTQNALHNLCEDIAAHSQLPTFITVGEQKIDTRTLSPTQKGALIFSVLTELYGDDTYGNLNAVAVHTADGVKHISVPSVLDDKEAVTGAIKTLEDYAGSKGIDISQDSTLGGGTAAAFALILPSIRQAFQSQSDKSAQRWPSTDTAKFIAKVEETTGSKLSRRALQVPSNSSLASPSAKDFSEDGRSELGKYTRLPIEVDECIDYLRVVDPEGQRGAMELQGWKTPDGREGYRLVLRGTQAWDGGSPQPQDMLTNFQAIAGLPSAQIEAAKAVLDAGVSAGAPVEIIGHSQAGIIGVQLASDPGVLAKHNIVSVITAGAPVAGADLPEKVGALHLINVSDFVPSLDGAHNVPSASHVNVLTDMGGIEGCEEAHGRDTYTVMAKAVINAEDPGIDWWAKRRAEAMNLDGALQDAHTQRIEVERVLIRKK